MKIKRKIKGSYRSLTVWFNSLIIAVIPVLEYTKELLPEMQQYLTPDTFKLVGLGVLIVNIALRFRTNKSLEEK